MVIGTAASDTYTCPECDGPMIGIRCESCMERRALALAKKTPAEIPIFGLDLGQTSDFTAHCGIGQTRDKNGLACYAVRFLERFQLGTPYPDQVTAVEKTMQRFPGAVLVVDQTGVGRPVVDMFRRRPGLNIKAVTITGGQQATEADDGWRVPKKDLVGAIQSVLSSRRLVIAGKLSQAATLEKELGNFKVKITAAANETFGAWREGQHDDLVLAVALAIWWAERFHVGAWTPSVASSEKEGRSLVADAPDGVFAS